MAVWMTENLPRDPAIVGIDHSNLTERLTLENWWDKAVVRRVDGKTVLADVLLLTRNHRGQKQRIFEVQVYGAEELNRWFEAGRLDEAIAYANSLGEPVPRPECPPEEEAPWVISFGPPRRESRR